MKIKLLILAGSVLSLAGSPLFGGTYSFSGNTAGGNVFNRPTEAGDSLSDVGTAVPFVIQPFNVGLPGTYNFITMANNPPAYDTFVNLYLGSFNPASPLSGLIASNDDMINGNSNAGSGLTAQSLTPGNNYIYVVNGFGNSDAGAFTASITGPGTISAVPEPSTYALIALALGGLLVVRKRGQGAA